MNDDEKNKNWKTPNCNECNELCVIFVSVLDMQSNDDMQCCSFKAVTLGNENVFCCKICLNKFNFLKWCLLIFLSRWILIE